MAVTIRGAPSCGNWIEEREKGSMSSLANGYWLLGFLSALAIETERDFIKGTDNASIFLWADNYCRANPIRDISDGGYRLFIELSKQKRM